MVEIEKARFDFHQNELSRFPMVGLTEADSKRYKAILRAKNQVSKSPELGCLAPDKIKTSKINNRAIDDFGEISTVKLQQGQKRLSPEEIEQVIFEYRLGKSIYELAEQFGCHRQTISNTLKKHGIKVDNRVAQKRLDADTVIAMYTEMYSSTEIGKRFGVHPQTVLRCLREHGVEIRKRGPSPQH